MSEQTCKCRYSKLTAKIVFCSLHGAAGELLEACHAFCSTMAFTPSTVPGALERDLNTAYNKARFAIRKAEGTRPEEG